MIHLEYKQVGITALRSPDGTFRPTVPVYDQVFVQIPESESEEQSSGLSITDEKACDFISTIFLEKFKEYRKKMVKAGIEI